MSDQLPVKSPAAKPRRDPVVTVVMTMAGFILLSPGVCSLFFLYGDGDLSLLTGGWNKGVLRASVAAWLALCLLIGAGGVALIVRAVRR
jgi:hypothetical protein